MKSAMLIFCSGLVVGGGLFAMGRSSAPATETERSRLAPTPSTGDERVEALERRVEMLTQALDSVGSAPSLPSAPRRGKQVDGMEAEGDETQANGHRDPLAPRMLELLESDEEFRHRMHEILRADRRERWEMNSAKRFARWMDRFSQKLEESEFESLSPSVQADLEGILEGEREQIRDGFRKARRGELTWDEARESARSLRRSNQEKIKPMLTEEQFGVFEAQRKRARGFR